MNFKEEKWAFDLAKEIREYAKHYNCSILQAAGDLDEPYKLSDLKIVSEILGVDITQYAYPDAEVRKFLYERDDR